MSHKFGGNWTELKLEVMKKYFSSYATALKNQSFSIWFIDAFAGTGERVDLKKNDGSDGADFWREDKEDINSVKDGSVKIALEIEPPFRRYVLIDKSPTHIDSLKKLKTDFPNRNIDVRHGDANQVLSKIANTTDWRHTRAAIFIDPYGMQVNWETLEALSKTKSVDIALLFPTGPLNRMLKRNAEIPDDWSARIDAVLGECDWRNSFYNEVEEEGDLFSHAEKKTEKVITADGLRQFAKMRLETIFPLVCDKQLEMVNSKGAVLYHLFIICANPSNAAQGLAKRLANSAIDIKKMG